MTAGADRGALSRGCPSGWRPPTSASTSRRRWCWTSLPGLLAELSARPGLGDGELLLIGRRHQRDNNSWLHNSARLTRGRPRHALLAHPDDLAARGIHDGDTVVVRSAVGEVHVEVAATDDVMPGWCRCRTATATGARGCGCATPRRCPGVTMNDLTDASVVEGLSGNAVLNGVPVTLARSRPVADDAGCRAPTRARPPGRRRASTTTGSPRSAPGRARGSSPPCRPRRSCG